MNIAEEILELLRKKAESDWEYINPHFLTEITSAIHGCYNLEDEVVDKWIEEMWGA